MCALCPIRVIGTKYHATMYEIQQKTGIEYPTCIDGIWMSRKSTCLLDSMMENFASEVGVIEAIFVEV